MTLSNNPTFLGTFKCTMWTFYEIVPAPPSILTIYRVRKTFLWGAVSYFIKLRLKQERKPGDNRFEVKICLNKQFKAIT